MNARKAAAKKSTKKSTKKPAKKPAAKKPAAKKPAAKKVEKTSAKAIRPGWATEIRKKKYVPVPAGVWQSVHAYLKDVGPDTFQESESAPFEFYELLVKETKYVLIYSSAGNTDTFSVIEYSGDPGEDAEAFSKAVFDVVCAELLESESDFEQGD